MENEKRAAADRDLAIKKAAYLTETNCASATADVAYAIQKAKQDQTVRACACVRACSYDMRTCDGCFAFCDV